MARRGKAMTIKGREREEARLILALLSWWPDKEGDIAPTKIMKSLCLGLYFLNRNFYMSCLIDPSATGSISYHTNSTLFCQKVVKDQKTVKETREVPSPMKASNRSQPTTSFYLFVDGACLFFFLSILTIIYLFLFFAMLGLCCCVQVFL